MITFREFAKQQGYDWPVKTTDEHYPNLQREYDKLKKRARAETEKDLILLQNEQTNGE